MFRKVILCMVVLLIFVKQSEARECPPNSLMAEFEHSHALVQDTSHYTVHIEGTVDMPNPGYNYSLDMEKYSSGEHAIGKLDFFGERPDHANIMVITPIMIQETIRIPRYVTGIKLHVERDFSWGVTSYSLDFPEGFSGSTVLCLIPSLE